MVSASLTLYQSNVSGFGPLDKIIINTHILADVTIYDRGSVSSHMEGVITKIGHPENRTQYSEEMRIKMGKNYVDARVAYYTVDDSIRSETKIQGYWDNGTQTLEIVLYSD